MDRRSPDPESGDLGHDRRWFNRQEHRTQDLGTPRSEVYPTMGPRGWTRPAVVSSTSNRIGDIPDPETSGSPDPRTPGPGSETPDRGEHDHGPNQHSLPEHSG